MDQSRHPDGQEPHQRDGVVLMEKRKAVLCVSFSKVTVAGCGKTNPTNQMF